MRFLIHLVSLIINQSPKNNQFKRCNFYFLINQDTHMQRKPTIPNEGSFIDMHFAVAPYEVQFSTPNDQIYSIYFQKGLQILGQTQYPIENHQKLKKLELPLQQNVIPFRLFSDKNAEYQWSIYKRVSEMQQFLETKKINLKDILKKQPEKKPQTPKPQLQKKQTSSKSEIRKSQLRSNSIRASGMGANEFATLVQQNLAKQFGDSGSESKGLVYNESVVSQVGKFTLKFYLFKASSNFELSKTIEDKAKQRQQAKATSHGNSGIKLPEITESDPQKETESNRNTMQLNQEIPVEEEILPNESAKKLTSEEMKENLLLQGVNTVTEQPAPIMEEPQEPTEEKTISKHQEVKKIVVSESPEPFSDNIVVQEQITSEQAFAAEQENPAQAIVQKPTQEPIKTSSGLKRTDSVIIEDNTIKPAEKGGPKKRHTPNIILAAIVIVLWLLSYLNIFDVAGYIPQGLVNSFNSTSSLKKGKKERFSNRKKLSN